MSYREAWPSRSRTRTSAALVGVLALALTASTSQATFPGGNGRIAYTTGNGEEQRYRIWTVRPDGTGNRVLLRATKRYDGGPANPRWSRDGKKVLFAQYHRTDGSQLVDSLWYASATGKRVTRIPLGLGPVQPYGYAWAPGGKRIVFAVFRTEGSGLYTISLNGTRRRFLTSGQRPSWSGDGRHIVFERAVFGPVLSTSRLFVIRPDGSGLRQLTKSEQDSNATFSPDDQRVVFTRFDNTYDEEWRVVDRSGARDQLVRRLDPRVEPPAPLTELYCPAQRTPDGSRLAGIRSELGPTSGHLPTMSFVTILPTGEGWRTAFRFAEPAAMRYRNCDFSWQPIPRRKDRAASSEKSAAER